MEAYRVKSIVFYASDYNSFHVSFIRQRSECRRSRCLVVFCITSVGNYEYGLFWYFQQDGSIPI